MRVLALDWGKVRIGAAISDPQGKIAFPLQNIISAHDSLTEIFKICTEQNVEKVIVGLPLGLKGQATDSTQEALAFINKLSEKLKLPVEKVDERLSSVQAGGILKDQGMPEKKQRTIKDNIAAQIFLQQYLEQQNN